MSRRHNEPSAAKLLRYLRNNAFHDFIRISRHRKTGRPNVSAAAVSHRDFRHVHTV